jgi:hypothetical protein
MFHGYSSLGAVALELIEHNVSGKLRRETKHNLNQAIEKVVWRKQTLAAMGSGTSYVWWWFHFDCGELSLEVFPADLSEVPYGDRGHRFVPLNSENFDAERFLADWEHSHDHDCDTILPLETTMIKMGIQPYQKCLTAYTETWSSDYYGESDCDIDARLLYVEPMHCNAVYLPIVIDRGFGPNEMKRLRLV